MGQAIRLARLAMVPVLYVAGVVVAGVIVLALVDRFGRASS
jgi:hypothetical protein